MLKCVAKIATVSILLFGSLFPTTGGTFEVELPEALMQEYQCLKYNLHFEARGEGTKGMIAVANVVVNRSQHPNFPNTICGVVFQKHKKTCQFSWVCKNPKLDQLKVDDRAKIIAYEAVVNKTLKDNTGGALFFHSGEFPGWNNVRPTVSIGNHTFYTYKRGNNAKRTGS